MEGQPFEDNDGAPQVPKPEEQSFATAANAEAPRNPEHPEPDTDTLSRLMQSFEQEINQLGWDRPALLFTLNRFSEHEVAIAPLTPPSLGASALELVEAITDTLKTFGPTRDIRQLLKPNYFGLLLTFEAWGRFDDNAVTTDPYRSLADQPGSVECRMVLVHTAGGQRLALSRIRGQEPVLAQGFLGGDLAYALNDMTTTINELLGGGNSRG